MDFLKLAREIRSFDKELKWSAFFAFGMLVWVFAERTIGLHNEHLYALDSSRHIAMIFFAVCYVACLCEKRKKHTEGVTSYWDSLVSCLAMTILVLFFLVPINYLTLMVVSPDLLLNQARYEMVNTSYSHHEIMGRYTIANYNIAYCTHIILYGLGLSLILPVFFIKTDTHLKTHFSR